MVKQAKAMIRKGELGHIRKVVVEYPQGWLSTLLEADANAKQAIWRTDPNQSGRRVQWAILVPMQKIWQSISLV